MHIITNATNSQSSIYIYTISMNIGKTYIKENIKNKKKKKYPCTFYSASSLLFLLYIIYYKLRNIYNYLREIDN